MPIDNRIMDNQKMLDYQDNEPHEEDIHDSDEEGGISSRSSVRRNLHQELNFRSAAFKRPSFNTRNEAAINAAADDSRDIPLEGEKDKFATFSFRKKSQTSHAVPESPDEIIPEGCIPDSAEYRRDFDEAIS